ncbi:hypothetical protein [Acidianus manzaensis]|uniref:Uncharacterized protein n=1 Tax=Acidianus manzaensis TaxID=282676 RepID=A0A1W6K3A8_9CREN|nr:hypothetical protein [Acidianus manzaensis]ARM76922.1 hypothetical protein B6F84_13440 [Acidianus manzaensis]
MAKGAIIGIIVVLIILGALYYVYTNGYFYSVNITGVYITFDNKTIFSHISVSYYNSSISIHGGQEYTIPINLTNNGLFSIEISSVSVSSPFTLVSATPIPYTLGHGQSVVLDVVIKAPMSSYTGNIDIYINGTNTL